MATRAACTWSSSSNQANAQKLRDRCCKDGGPLRSGSRSGFGYHDHSTPNPNQSCYPDSYSTDTGKGRELEAEPLTWDWRDGLWRSLVSALDWGSRGPGFKSRQPDAPGILRLTFPEVFGHIARGALNCPAWQPNWSRSPSPRFLHPQGIS